MSEKDLWFKSKQPGDVLLVDEDDRPYWEKPQTEDIVFKKDTTDKTDMTLLPLDLLENVAKVLEYGAKKYARENWRNLDDPNKSLAALLRHVTNYQKGDILDKETNLNHMYHVICNALFIANYHEKKQS